MWDSRSGIVAAEKVTLVSSAYILGEESPHSNNLVDHLYRLRKEEDQLLTLEVRHNLEGSR